MSIVTTGNSALAILAGCKSINHHSFHIFIFILYVNAGFLCDLMVRQLGLPTIAPFVAAVPCLLAALVIINMTWTENYGKTSTSLLQLYLQGIVP